MIDQILKRVFVVLSFYYFDDKFGFEPESTIETAEEVASSLHPTAGGP